MAQASVNISRGSSGPASPPAGAGSRFAQGRPVWDPSARITVETDSRGVFRFSYDPSAYYGIAVSMPRDSDYGAGSASLEPGQLAEPNAVLRIPIQRSVTVTGDVVDAETGEPAAGLRVSGLPFDRLRTERMPIAQGGMGLTDERGQFAVRRVRAGEIAVRIDPVLWASGENLLREFSGEDIEVVDRDYEVSFWPGGTTAPPTSPVPVTSGASVHLGTFRARQTDYYRLHVIADPDVCLEESSFTVALHRPPDATSRTLSPDHLGAVACGEDFLIRGLLPGSYRLEMFDEWSEPEDQLRAIADFNVTDGNATVEPVFQHDPDLHGRVILPEGVEEWPARIGIALSPRNATMTRDSEVQPASDGSFVLHNLPLGSVAVHAPSRGAQYPIAAIRYAGREVTGEFFWDGGGTLEIDLEGSPATITGTVKQGDTPVGSGTVIGVRWPLPAEGLDGLLVGMTLLAAEVDANGRFRLEGLAAGEYRLAAFSPGGRQQMPAATELEALIASGEPVRVSSGEVQDVALKAATSR